MMKRTRVDEVQFGTRPGPPTSGGVGVGVVGVAGGGPASGSGGTATVGVNTAGVTIGTVVPGGAHNATISGIGSIHHRILTPQHGGAQTIAYLPSTTPSATNLKTTSSIVDSTSAGGPVGSGAQVAVGGVGAAAGGGGVAVSTGSTGTQTLQYTTSYSVASIQAGGTLKANTADVANTVQIHVTGGAGANNPASAQTVSSSSQTGTLRQRTISGTQTVATAVGNLASMSQQQPVQQPPLAAAQTPPSSVVANSIPVGGTTPPQGQSGNATPRLKVEDALSYLDQVKYQYADQPQIYNNFLDIMKEFKSHCIDTPGVIERVSTLFKGHTELIYGFNMFLPPGYKIEIHSDALGCSVPVVSMPSPPGAPSSTGTVHMLTGSSPLSAGHIAIKTTNAATLTSATGAVAAAAAAVAQIQSAGAVNLMTHGGASLTQTTIHALQQQATPPQSQSPGGGHVHVSVTSSPASSAVVTGQQPPGISVSAHNVPRDYSRDRERATITPTGQVAGGAANANAAASIVVGGPPTPNSLSELSPHGGAGSGPGAGAAQHNLHHIQQAHQSILLGETGQQNQPVEFNHAITYVNKIKNRFQNQPAKYKKFLEILHAYQREQKAMKEGSLIQGKMLTEQEVYTQVAKLFGQDEDLLREFGQFLPDATNHQSGQYMSKSASVHNDHGKRPTATLSGGAHITMSSASPAPGGSPLHLGGGAATIPQIDNSAHAAAIGNLSAVNTSVSIKTYNNNQQQQNHVIGSGLNSTTRNDVLFEKDFHPSLQQQAHQRGAGVGGHHHLAGTPAGANIGRPGVGASVMVAFDKEHRNNHHVQKYVGHAPNANLSHGHNAKKSPSYGLTSVIGSMPHMSENSLDRSSPGINYPTPPLPSGHHGQHNSGSASRRPGDDSLAGHYASGAPPAKRPKPYCRDVSFSEASSKCTISDAAFFDKVRKALRSPEVYDNFLRCLTLFNQEIVSKTELLGLVSPFLMKFPDLLRWFTDFLGPPSGQAAGGLIDGMPLAATQRQGGGSSNSSHDRGSSHQSAAEYVQDVDLSSCKRLGASYCALPQSTVPKKCSGRTALCREVLNDKWVSFPTWASEDSTFVTSRKTQFEETIYRTEDERFELDLVIEVNSATIRVLENVQKKMSRMSTEELAKFHLDDHLGGTSQTIHQRAIHRIYGDKSGEIIQGMKKNPSVAVPIVLKRLKVKEEEWREAQKTFNKQWREQNEKYYLKSLDHQAINFKPNDMKALRSKSLFNEIETLYDERHDQDDDAMEPFGPHLVLPYKDKTILDDAANLLIHHVKRQTGIQKQEKQKIKQIIRQFVPDLFFAPRQPLSDDEREDAFPFLVDDNTKMDVDSPLGRTESTSARNAKSTPSEGASPARSNASSSSGTPAGIKKETDDPKAGSGPAAAASATTSSSADDATPSTSSAAAAAAAASSSSASGSESKAKDEPNSAHRDEGAGISTAGAVSSPRHTQDSGAPGGDVEIKVEHPAEFANPKLLPPHAHGQHEDESYSLFFANNNWYLFLRLHAILCDRLHVMYERARLLAIEEERCRANRRESTATALRLKPKPEIQVEDYYPTFLDMLKNVLDGNMDSNTFEDTMREMFGIYAYISFTLDKVVSNAVRQLQYCVTERAALDCVELFATEQRRGCTGGLCRDAHKTFEREMSYQRKAESILNDENCFKVYIYKIDCRVTIELLDSEPEELDKPAALKAQKFSKYVERLANPGLGSGGGGNGAGSSSALANDNIVEASDIKTEEEEDTAELRHRGGGIGGGGARKARFLLRNKRRSQLHEEQVRQLFEQKQNQNQNRSEQQATAAGVAVESVTGDNIISSSSASGVGGGGNNNNNNNSWGGKRLPERLGAPQVGLAEQYAFNDRDEITTNASNGRCFVYSKNLKLLKYDAVRRAKKSHCRVTRAKYARFQNYVNKWLQQQVSEQLQQNCIDWLLGKTPDQINASGWGSASKTKTIQQKDTSKTPYRIYNRYKVVQSAVSGLISGSASTPDGAVPAVNSVPSGSSASAVGNALASTTVSSTSHAMCNSSILSADSTTNANATPQQQHCNSAAAAASATTNAEALQQVRPMES
ncbi:uncharacterized protein LOC108096633 isoform X2 [Drosophila ficusphila]|uniref:uncharacterized protein LOC108096633 isoform X2 n=1 Tax=Drosophila ficusphila TaxID=30025 RepID=UPI0007E817CE|nr:uncharacterized protein LOC108096633 isoform X2 [Drosophila ficusphila]